MGRSMFLVGFRLAGGRRSPAAPPLLSAMAYVRENTARQPGERGRRGGPRDYLPSLPNNLPWRGPGKRHGRLHSRRFPTALDSPSRASKAR